jgi:magnesium transporter
MIFFYLSQILRRPVRTGRGERVAKIKDVVARLEALNAKGEASLEAYPQISGLVVEIENRPIFIPWQQVRALGPDGADLGSATIDLRPFERREGEVLLARDILDKQLIDIDGRRVIRANDLQLYQSDGVVRVTAVDVSGEALVRRLTFGRLFRATERQVKIPTEEEEKKPRRRALGPAKLIEWRDIEPLRAGVPDVRLRLSHERLALLHPVDIAHIADELSYKEGAEIIESLDDERAADTLQEMDEERQADIVEGMDQERAADILEEMDPDDAADLLADLDEDQQRELLQKMEPDEAEDVQELLVYDEDSAGGLMTTDFITVPASLTVAETIAWMRKIDDPPDVIDYLYVVEEEEGHAVRPSTLGQQETGRLLGIVTLRDVLLSPPERELKALMNTDFPWIGCEDSRDKAARMIADYNLLALPVLDEHDRLVGIITVDDAMELLVPDERWLNRIPRVFG